MQTEEMICEIDTKFCAERNANVFADTEVHGRTGSWKTNAAFRQVS